MIVELESLLAFLTQIVFLFVAGGTLVNWLVFRDLARFDIALIFLPLALAILAQNLQRLFPGWETLLALVFFLALLSHPHLLLRVAQYFRPVPVVVRRASLVSLLLIVASLPLAKTAPLAVFTPAIGYFMVVEAYAGILFVLGARRLGAWSAGGCGLPPWARACWLWYSRSRSAWLYTARETNPPPQPERSSIRPSRSSPRSPACVTTSASPRRAG